MKSIKVNARKSGAAYELLAKKYLIDHGLKPLTDNYYCKAGEIDLIMLDQTTLVFIEVRYRNDSAFGDAAATVTRIKQKKIIKTANFFLGQNKKYCHRDCRFDVIGINEDGNGKTRIDWITNAFME